MLTQRGQPAMLPYRRRQPAQPGRNPKVTRLVRGGLLSLLLLSLFGCSVGPDYVRPEFDSPAVWRIDYAAAADAVNTRWWEQFEDPVLDQLIDTALRENRDVRIAAARVEEFSARVDVSRSGFYPQIGYNGQASRNQASRENFGGIPSGSDRIYNNYAATLNAGWEIDLWGRIRSATEASRAELQYVSVRGDLYSSLVNTYKAMGGGWVIQAQATANETDFPAQ